MKRIIFLLVLSVGQILECQSFEFRNLFGSYSKDASSYSSSNIQASSLPSNLLNSEEKLENVSHSLVEDDDRVYNASVSSINEFLDTIRSEQLNISNDSLMNANLTDVVLNGSENHVSVQNSKVITSTEKSVTDTSVESTTADNLILNKTESSASNVTTSTEEIEEVVLGEQPSTFTYVTKTIYQKTVDFMGDPYTLSIFVPIAAGVLFALSIIFTIVTCRCIKKKCRRRRFRKRVLPDSIKNLRPSDQARLLGDCYDSSDEF